jgi:hypothetical protein
MLKRAFTGRSIILLAQECKRILLAGRVKSLAFGQGAGYYKWRCSVEQRDLF